MKLCPTCGSELADGQVCGCGSAVSPNNSQAGSGGFVGGSPAKPQAPQTSFSSSPQQGGYAPRAGGSMFTSFINPVLDMSEKGVILRKGFGVLYVVSAVASLLLAVVMLVTTIVSLIAGGQDAGVIMMGIIIWAAFAFSCWLNFQLWWNRGKRLKNLYNENDAFVAVPLVSDFIKVTGESCAITFAAGGLPLSMFIGLAASGAISGIGGTLGVLFGGLILGVPIGYAALLISRYIAEMATALASIANNTKATAVNTKR